MAAGASETVGSSQLGMSLCLMQPGDEIRRHSHDYEEAYYVLRGSGSMHIEGEPPIHLEPGLADLRAGRAGARPGGRSRRAAGHHPRALTSAGRRCHSAFRGAARPHDGRRRADRGEGAALAEGLVRLIEIAKVGHYRLGLLLRRRFSRRSTTRDAVAPGRAGLARPRPLPVRARATRPAACSRSSPTSDFPQGVARRLHPSRQPARRPPRHDQGARRRLQLGVASATPFGWRRAWRWAAGCKVAPRTYA